MKRSSVFYGIILILTLASMNNSVAGVRKVLVEVFSSTTDSNSFQPVNYYFNEWLPFYSNASKVVTISYHTWYPVLGDLFYLVNPQTIRNRAEYYSQMTTPNARVNGTLNGSEDVLRWIALTDSAAQTSSPLTLTMSGGRGGNGVYLNASIRADSAVNSGNWRLYFAVVESDLFQPQNSPVGFVPFLHQFVLRGIYPDSIGIPITISQGQTINKSQFVALRSSWQFPFCRFIAFIQDSVTRSIQNAEMIGRERIVGVDEDEKGTPGTFALFQNYPNPFNPTTKIEFRLPAGKAGIANFGFVSLKVFDLLGREVATLVNEEMKPGSYERTFDGNNLASGIYFYRLQAGNFLQTRKFVLLR